MQHNLGPSPPTMLNHKQFKKVSFKDFVLTVHQYSKSDCYCMINDQIIEIHNFLRNNDIILILGRKFCTYESLYTYPFTSKNLKIFVIDKLNDDLECWKLSHIDSKCFVFPFNNKHVSFPLLHT